MRVLVTAGAVDHNLIKRGKKKEVEKKEESPGLTVPRSIRENRRNPGPGGEKKR